MGMHQLDVPLVQAPLFPTLAPILINGEALDPETEQDVYVYRLSVKASEEIPGFNQMDITDRARILLELADTSYPTLSVELIANALRQPMLLDRFEA